MECPFFFTFADHKHILIQGEYSKIEILRN